MPRRSFNVSERDSNPNRPVPTDYFPARTPVQFLHDSSIEDVERRVKFWFQTNVTKIWFQTG